MSGGGEGHSLDLKAITHRFGDNVAANAIDLSIRPGELVSLLGPSGCGKTTLLKIIAGFLRQTSGDVLLDGQSVSHLPANRRQVGIVFQNYALFPHMTVGENIAYGLAARRRPRAEQEAVVEEMLALVQMGAFRDRLPRQLSGGQQQRIALARCLAIRPSILLLDEPFSALDKNLRLDMQIEIKRVQQQSGITTVLVTHDQEEAMSMSDRIAVLHRGNLEQFASPTEIYDRPASLFVNSFVGTANLLPGRLVTGQGGGAAVQLSDGMVIDTGQPTPLPSGSDVRLSLRPEALRLSREQGEGGIPATVATAMPIGPSILFEVRLANGALVKVIEERAGRDASDLAGNQVFLFIDNRRVSGIFPASSA
ncbi:Sulfate/thiosulfate import ATP-binding protein CysA [Hartmannibacter diazotrophicus]|uniref:Sulfate/thiosulfate import ATP-binding protein CysA n=1 Tax=Hartmannibacter diazotrophicus TaxID=1482074 RepID=A0A2C9D943_9HYPH|nr:ABC transporter ATP-binding protein [Hartmannibacter diazotrophicus]SON56753.1 Sulfate/thiosulfate import ATP-binding protein CysA [Hartmannibacter diazotrophicus]